MTEQPSPFDRAYFPTTTDIGNHLYKARMGLQLSKIDQENLAAKVKEWQKHTGEDFHYFRPYKSETDGHGEVTQLLWVHHKKWQQDLMCRYGNQISLIDATYRTMRYKLPMFFICTRTNVGYSIIAQFFVQSESEECTAEALCVLKAQNPSWNPPYFMCDFSDAEISALQEVFPNCTVYGCNFHREQAWTRWVQSRKSGLSREDGDHLLELLRACAWAASGEDESIDVNYCKAVSALQRSSVWKDNSKVLLFFRGGHMLSEITSFMLLWIQTTVLRHKISF